ncbi:Amidase chyE [Pseudocercospora fuligena]|uniref:Amidase chyE n=1 Tax=Pseudocercospora fuligena TaxID=685502 RepID=A0A8H6RR43_9PEZI|nr:Amidase chyE [Pseudocercospora fuligena]
MCGIIAVIALEQRSSREIRTAEYRQKVEQQLANGLKTIHHRGPDAQGIWISANNRVALGHVRLSIKDLSSAGHQPLHDPDNNIHAIVNGEIYDYEKLREELEPAYDFKSRSDSELVVALYRKYGISLFSHLRGEFSFVLYDEQRQLLLCARDRFGVKPLFWTVSEGRLLIASEAKAFKFLGFQLQWDVRSIVDDGWLSDERTLFKCVRKLLPANYMTCLSFEYLTHNTYWETVYPDKHTKDTRTEEEIVQQLRDRLYYAVKTRMQADVPVAVYLSGGIDSSVVAGIVCDILASRGKTNEHSRRDSKSIGETAPITCFTVAFDEKTEYNELPIAERTAKYLNVPLHTVRMDEAAFADNFEAATIFNEQNNIDLNYVGKYCLSKLVQDHGVKVVLTGEGSDEHLGGYTWLYPSYLREPDYSRGTDPLTPEERLKRTADLEMSPSVRIKGTNDPRSNPLARTMLNDIICPWGMMIAPMASWTKTQFGQLDPKETQANIPGAKQLEKIANSWHPFHSGSYVWTRSMLPNILLTTLGDRMEMAHSIEGRPPFLDHDLTNFNNHIPPSLKVKYDPETNEFREKWVLYEAAKPFVSQEMYERKKRPFMAPVEMKAGGPMHKMLSRLITRENIGQLGFVDVDGAMGALEEAFRPGGNPVAFRMLYAMAQWVTMAKAFDIPTAVPDE